MRGLLNSNYITLCILQSGKVRYTLMLLKLTSIHQISTHRKQNCALQTEVVKFWEQMIAIKSTVDA